MIEKCLLPQTAKQAVELIFSTRKVEMNHPEIRFNNVPVVKVDEHKHLGIILDTKLSFSTHIKTAISKTRKGMAYLNISLNIFPGTP